MMTSLWLLLVCMLLAIDRINAECDSFNPCELRGGDPFERPREIRSIDGRLEFLLQVEIAELAYDWLKIKRRTYNGTIPGPTWRLRAGDRVNLTLVNTLEKTNEIPGPMNTLRYPNHTNVHTHGLHISSRVPSDNVFINVEPGMNFTYQYHIANEQPSGSYWYHAHFHGSVMFQVEGGMGGMIIIEDPTSGPFAMPRHLAEISCPDHCEHEIPMFFHSTLQYAHRGFTSLQKTINDSIAFRNMEMTSHNITLEEWMKNPANNINHFTTNGKLFPVLQFETGQRKRFRMVNGAGLSFLEVLITEKDGLVATDNCEVWEIGYDGVYFDEARRPRLNKTLLVSSARAEWIVVCSKPGIYELKSISEPFENCSIGRPLPSRFNGLLVTLNVTGDHVKISPQDRSLPKRPYFLHDFRNEPKENFSKRTFTIELSANQNLNRDRFLGPNYYRYKFELGKVHEWHFTNSDPTSGHPLHIHLNSFQIISYNDYHGPISASNLDGSLTNVYYSQDGRKCSRQCSTYTGGSGDFKGLHWVNDTSENACPAYHVVNHKEQFIRGGPRSIGYGTIGDFHDVLIVPPLANITVRFLPQGFTGEVVVHCHLLVHEDYGMMMTLEIVNEGSMTR